MKVSIFSDLTYATWIDYSYTPEDVDLSLPSRGDPNCIACLDIDFDPETQALEFAMSKKKLTYEIVSLPEKPEDPHVKHQRILLEVVWTPDLKSLDIEWESFTDMEIGEIICKRCFKGNPHAQMSLLRKIAKIQDIKISGEEITPEMQELLDYAKQIDSEIELILNLLG